MQKKFFKLVAIFLFSIFLLVFSEFLYLYSNSRLHYFFGSYCFYGVQFGLLREDQIFTCFEKASEWVYKESTLSQEVNPALVPFSALPIANLSKLSKYLYEYAKTYPIDDFFTTEQSNLAKVYYLMALRAFELGENESTELLLQRCISLSPQLSYCHVELSNFYLAYQKVDLAVAAITRCQEFRYAANYCTMQLGLQSETNSARPVGFLLDSMNDYYALKI